MISWGMRTYSLAALAILFAGCTNPPVGDHYTDPEETCGDGVCSAEDAESCEVCAADCGECGTCGDGQCDYGREDCESCPSDCGQCAVCGDDTCDALSGEDCSSCPEDCGACPDCGDGVCDGATAEDCASCPEDCGECTLCGDGECVAGDGEDCASCPEDCGGCATCGDGECDPDTEDCLSCEADCGECPPRPGCIQGTFHAYWGNLHSHTSYSDGVGTPGEAFAHAQAAGLDFLWVTDHAGRLSQAEWVACKNQANAANQVGTFAAGCGWEWAIEGPDGQQRGHANVLFTGSRMSRPSGVADLYAKVASCSPCVGQFNHPPWPGTFLNWAFDPVGEDGMRLMELSGHGDWDDKWAALFTALRNGWLISPSCNEDNHSRNWGDSHRATGVWATELSRVALRKAIRKRRSFATFDDTAWIKMKADGECFMGSVLQGLGDTELTVVAKDRQAGDTFRRIRLYGRNGQILASRDCHGANPCTATFNRSPGQATFFVAMAIQDDGDRLVSAPIWYEP